MKIPNKTKIGILIFGSMTIAIIVQSFSLNMNSISNQANFVDVPPILEQITIQKMSDSLSTGENVIVRPTYSYYDTLPQIIFIFTGQDSFAFNDDGVYPDESAGDKKYAAFLKIDIPEFILDVTNRENEIAEREYFIVFDGHEGHYEYSVTPFNYSGFDLFQEVSVDANLIMANNCDGSILKQNSLFITDLEVVEDTYRTFNPTGNGGNGSGTPNGIWTFGKFMTNMANTTSTGVTASDFIKNWLMSYMEDVPLQNVTQIDQTLPRPNKRELILDILIRPWIHKANGENANDFISSSGEFVINASNWKEKWDAANDADLIKNAPFKLTAIVNRLDLRNNVGYTNKISRAGETRFIFTAINLIDLEDVTGELATGSVGNIPINNLNINSTVKFLDWQGMNVIFEFGNVQTDLCAIKSFAQAWTNLSTLTLGSSDYNNALEDITETVINANAGSTAGKPNGSALNQLRTNEKIFFNTISNNLSNINDWNNASWQFRQFEIDQNTNQLVLKPLTNTPIIEDYNNSHNVTFNNSGSRPAYLGSHLTSWIYKNQERVRRESHTIPATFDYAGDTYKFLEKTGDVDAEYAFYWDLKYEDDGEIPYFNYSNETVSSNTQNKNNGKDLRFKFSLNTCQGCHSGETKTFSLWFRL